MDAIKAINKEADFWMQMYEEASVQREKAVNAARNYRRRAALMYLCLSLRCMQ